MKTINAETYASEDVGFYPTPPELVEKMLENVTWRDIVSVLEPSAGKGNIVDVVLKDAYLHRQGRYGHTGVTVDCIEIDADLRGILHYKYNGKRLSELNAQRQPLRELSYSYMTDDQKKEYDALEQEIGIMEATKVSIIADDFLAFKTYKHYDLIIMNPPFENGDLHLLHAIDVQKNGGAIVCLLNAETIRNTYTNTRKLLMNKLNKYGAQIRYIQNAFSGAERKTDVEIALIEIIIPAKEKTSFIFEGLKRAQEKKTENRETTELTSGDYLERIVSQFNFEVEGTMRLINEYEAMKPYMLVAFGEEKCSSILTLSLVDDKTNYEQLVDVNKYLRLVRLKYWRTLFKNKEFTGTLTKNLYEKYYNVVESMGDYDFTLYNIKAFHQKMMSELTKGLDDTILSLFDTLTAEHSWYPECSANIHYFNGWATNKAHMINTKKVIIPMYGMFANSWSAHSGVLNEYRAYEELSDIEKVFNYLSNDEIGGPDLREQIDMYSKSGNVKKIPLKYFWATFYKKGTCHLEWRVPELVEKLNIYGCQHKNWLPPCYGKKRYKDMTEEERQVIDEFQGESDYAKVMANPEHYLMELSATGNRLLIGPGENKA